MGILFYLLSVVALKVYFSLGRYVGPRQREMPGSNGNIYSVNLTWNLTECERAYLAVASVTIFPLRAVLVVSAFIFGWCQATIVLIGVPPGLDVPLPQWRVFMLKRLLAPTARILLFFAGYHFISRSGNISPHQDAPIVVSNHVSLLDILFHVADRLPSPVGALEHTNSIFLRPILLALQQLSLDRNSVESRKKIAQKLKEYPRESSRPQILIFAEGTMTNGIGLAKFKPGGFLSGMAVQPVFIDYTTKYVCDVSWSWGPPLFFIIFRLLCSLWNGVHIHYLPVYNPSEEEKADPSLFAENVRLKICKSIGVSPIKYGAEDILEQYRLAALAQSQVKDK
jgi:lysophosphatidylcholine acyltransferase/lyso-PAF acetyltransferase